MEEALGALGQLLGLGTEALWDWDDVDGPPRRVWGNRLTIDVHPMYIKCRGKTLQRLRLPSGARSSAAAADDGYDCGQRVRRLVRMTSLRSNSAPTAAWPIGTNKLSQPKNLTAVTTCEDLRLFLHQSRSPLAQRGPSQPSGIPTESTRLGKVGPLGKHVFPT